MYLQVMKPSLTLPLRTITFKSQVSILSEEIDKIRDDLVNNDVELLFIQISNPRSKPFLVGTWYRPPSSALNLFSLFLEIIDKIDSENSELYLLGDLNCDLLSHSPNVNTCELLDICDIYNLTQLITDRYKSYQHFAIFNRSFYNKYT